MAGTLLLAPGLAAAEEPQDLSALSIEELAEVEVTSVSKRAESLAASPAAIFVIDNDDIRRAGASSLPEALRLAPNLQVQRIDARQYAITARGFQGYETANKLLARIDGRTIYTPLFSGVLWDLYDVVLEDVAQIEVVSGPGGTLYGPNAVNGVINVMTRSAADTLGLMARGTAGASERTAALRYGTRLGDSGAIRLFGSAYDRDGFAGASGRVIPDGGSSLHGGFRADWSAVAGGALTVQGDMFRHEYGTGTDKGHNLLARWSGEGLGGAINVQFYWDKFDRNFITITDALETIDLEAQHDWSAGAHRVVWGLGARTTKDAFINPLNAFGLNPPERRLWVGNIFVQDTIALSERWSLILGSKIERTSFTGIQLLPNVRLAWRPAEHSLFWAAASRAVRTPSRVDRDLEVPGLIQAGTVRSEELLAVEAGYRGQLLAGTTLSVSVFFNRYDGIRTTEPAPAGLFPVRLRNGLEGYTYGIEAWGAVQAAPGWRLSAGVTALGKDFELKPGFVDIEDGVALGNDPDSQLTLRSQADLTNRLSLDVSFRLIDSLPDPRVKSYAEADARLGWRANDQVELFVAGTNLFHKHRDESADTDRGQLVSRSVTAGLRLTY